MKPEFMYFMDSQDYIYIGSNLPEYHIFFHLERGFVNAVQFLEYNDRLIMDEMQLRNLDAKMHQLFEEKGIKEVHGLTVLICPDAVNQGDFGKESKDIWFVDLEKGVLNIPEGNREDFYGLKGQLYLYFNNRENYQSEAKQAILKREEEQASLKKSGVKNFFESLKSPEFWRNFPLITIILVLTNIIVFIVCSFTGETLYIKGCFNPDLALQGKEFYRYLTALFLHIDGSHILSNMLILYYLGSLVEQECGKIRFTLIYFFSGFLSMFASLLYSFYTASFNVSIGASGAVFGVIGALLWLVVEHKGRLKSVTTGRILFVITYSVYSGLMSENIDNAAHIGGLISGFVSTCILWGISLFVRKLKKKGKQA